MSQQINGIHKRYSESLIPINFLEWEVDVITQEEDDIKFQTKRKRERKEMRVLDYLLDSVISNSLAYLGIEENIIEVKSETCYHGNFLSKIENVKLVCTLYDCLYHCYVLSCFYICRTWFTWDFFFKFRAIYLSYRVEELTSDCLKLKEINDALQIDLAKQIEQSENFKKVMFSLFLSLCLSV